MSKLKELNAESTSVAGFYFGLIGVAIGLIGVLLSVYSLIAGEKAFWLGVSGWISALLLGFILTKLCFKLINIHTDMGNSITALSTKNAELESRTKELEYANDKLLEIDSYIISKTVRAPVKTRKRTTDSEVLVTNTLTPTPHDTEDVFDGH